MKISMLNYVILDGDVYLMRDIEKVSVELMNICLQK